jgi:thiol-disulfide isomerase/thioredoxin
MLKQKNIFLALITLWLNFFAVFAVAAPAAVDIYGRPFHIPLGKWVVVNYWASWCSACISEIPDLNHFADISRSMNVIFFAVNYDQIPDNLQQLFAKKYGVEYTLLHNNPLRNLVPEDAITSLPMTYVISPDGRTQALYGTQTSESLVHTIS